MHSLKKVVTNEVKNKYNYLPYIFGIIFLLLYSVSTSPITSNFWGSDSAVFQMSGRAILKGKIMYRDIFDIKGPYLFLIEYLGYFLGGRYGIFALQIVNLSVILYFISRCINFLDIKNRKYCWIVSYLLFFFYMACTFDCGNLTEEYAMPYLFFALFLYFRYKDKKVMGHSALGLGVAFSIAAMGRVTNAAFVAVIVLTICMELFLKKEWKEILRNAGWFLLGMSAAFLPFGIYYAWNGAFEDMVYAVFSFSFRYATEMKLLDHLYTLRWPVMLFFWWNMIMAFIAKRGEKYYRIFVVLNITIMTIILNLGNSYIHYYQLLIPSILAGVWMYWSKLEEIRVVNLWKQITLAIILMLTSIVYLVPQSGRVVAAIGVNNKRIEETGFGRFARKLEQLDSYGRGTYGYTIQEQVNDILCKIPENKKDSLYNYATNLQWLLLSGGMPYNKYCIDADRFSCLSAQIASEIQKMFQEEPPQYVVTDINADIKNEKVKAFLKNDYKEIYRNTLYSLYERKI